MAFKTALMVDVFHLKLRNTFFLKPINPRYREFLQKVKNLIQFPRLLPFSIFENTAVFFTAKRS